MESNFIEEIKKSWKFERWLNNTNKILEYENNEQNEFTIRMIKNITTEGLYNGIISDCQSNFHIFKKTFDDREYMKPNEDYSSYEYGTRPNMFIEGGVLYVRLLFGGRPINLDLCCSFKIDNLKKLCYIL